MLAHLGSLMHSASDALATPLQMTRMLAGHSATRAARPHPANGSLGALLGAVAAHAAAVSASAQVEAASAQRRREIGLRWFRQSE